MGWGWGWRGGVEVCRHFNITQKQPPFTRIHATYTHTHRAQTNRLTGITDTHTYTHNTDRQISAQHRQAEIQHRYIHNTNIHAYIQTDRQARSYELNR